MLKITGGILEKNRCEESMALATKSFFGEAFTAGLPIVTTC